jgi:hypothetical protein
MHRQLRHGRHGWVIDMHASVGTLATWQLTCTCLRCCTAGFVGYSTYAPTKYALRGLADTLRNEARRSGACHEVRW